MTNTILHFGHKGLNPLVAPNANNINIKTTMKKILLTLAAVAALVSCSNEEIVDLNRTEIAFGSAFIENSTRALGDDYSGSKALLQFTLYGTVTGNAATVNLYDAATVTGTVGAATWNCTQTQYWVPNASYKFAAVVDGTVADADKDAYGMPTHLGYTVANGGGDLLYAEVIAATNATATPTSGVNTNGVVAFTMNHLLSKVYFHITNSAGSNDYSYQVTGITVNNAYASGKYEIAEEKWTASGDVDGLNFGTTGGVLANGAEADATEDQLIIPAAQTLEVVISYDILFKGPNASVATKISETTATKSLTYTFEKNKVYRVGVTLPAPGKPIEFTISTAPAWNGTEVNI